jgi:multidrug efflux pump
MLNARLIRKDKGHSRFYMLTEPFFRRLDEGYRNALTGFMHYRRVSWWILLGVVVMILFFGSLLQSEVAPLEDRNWFRLLVTAPEGASFEYTDRHMNAISQMVIDSVPERRICLTVTAPGFTGSGAVNTGFVRIALTPPETRKRSQQQLAGPGTRCRAAVFVSCHIFCHSLAAHYDCITSI